MSDTAPNPEDAQQEPEVDETSTPEPAETSTDTDEFKSEESKQAVLADLKTEREKRKKLQQQIEAYKQAEAEAEKAKLSDIERAQAEAKEYQEAAEKSNRELSVYKLATGKGLSDPEDIDLLMEIESEEAREKLADRLVARASGPKNPQPDPSAGPKNTPVMTEAEKVAAAEKEGDQAAASLLKAQQLGKLSQANT